MDSFTCKYCGKSHLNLENLKFKSNKEAEEYATLHCDCAEGEEYRNLIESKNNLNKFLNSTSYDKETRDFLTNCGLRVLNVPDDVINYQFSDTKIKFAIKKGRLKIEIVKTNKTERTF